MYFHCILRIFVVPTIFTVNKDYRSANSPLTAWARPHRSFVEPDELHVLDLFLAGDQCSRYVANTLVASGRNIYTHTFI